MQNTTQHEEQDHPKTYDKIGSTRPHYWKHRFKSVDVRVQEAAGGYDLDLIIDGVVEPVGHYEKEQNALTEAIGWMNENPEPDVERTFWE